MKLSKSKLALAKVINENGGWVNGSKWASQDKQHCQKRNVVSFYAKNKPWHNGGNFWRGNDVRSEKIYAKELIRNWHQTCLSREEYYQAYPKADADGWIEWHGVAKSPVSKGVSVDVKMKNGTQHFGQLIDDECWGDHWGDASIIAYRLHKPDVKPEPCESVTRSIPEPESIDELCSKVTSEKKHQHVDAKPTIEQLAQDYKKAKSYADMLQKEFGDASMYAESIKVEIRKKMLELQELIG